MTEASLTPQEKARKAHAKVLQAMQSPGKGGAVAAVLGVSDSTVSRIKTEHMEGVLSLLYALGFKVVPEEVVCYAGEYVQALHTMAKIHMQTEKEPLQWD